VLAALASDHTTINVRGKYHAGAAVLSKHCATVYTRFALGSVLKKKLCFMA
jgi:hypothetical protein